MADIIFFTGAPGSGKSTAAAKLHELTGAPWFEFGWIPEFRRLNPHTEISYEQEAQLSMENLTMVAKNYLRHGFTNVIISDLGDADIVQMYAAFDGYSRKIIRLYCDDETTKTRVLTRDNGNEFRDWEAALRISREIAARPMLTDEAAFDSAKMSPEEIAQAILQII
jgi:dephospho-CoA kinase